MGAVTIGRPSRQDQFEGTMIDIRLLLLAVTVVVGFSQANPVYLDQESLPGTYDYDPGWSGYEPLLHFMNKRRLGALRFARPNRMAADSSEMYEQEKRVGRRGALRFHRPEWG